ncbi:hypothetical protein GBAR_LOCUS14377 [Geodia barretti]|uniref:Uncharacterized protein n=1 Tax=Geodia barretti TaxID=519541 RepID=A0AA35S7C9_GEOBA|nr:hypothetical protein GBAR_LOCUS14377 [Geodia barretti]
MSHDLDYFKRMFVQAGFIRSSNASGILGLLGETRQQKFHKFVEMLMREASTEDLGNRILHSYVVVNDVTLHEREFPYLPGTVRTQLGKVMVRRGLLCARNMPLVLGDYYTHNYEPVS